MRIEINKEWFDEHKDELIKGHDMASSYVIEISDYKLSVDKYERNPYKIHRSQLCCEFSIYETIELDNEDLSYMIENANADFFIQMLGVITKKMNQFKTLLESAKTLF